MARNWINISRSRDGSEKTMLKGSKKIGDHTVICDFIDNGSLFLDCGANYGEFSKSVSELFSAQVYGFEPDPRLFDKLPTIERVKFLNYAIASSCGTLKLSLGESQCSSAYYRENGHQEVVEVAATTISDVLARYNLAKVNLLKLDVEGAELEILDNLDDRTFSRIDQITVEFHDFRSREDLPRIRNIIGKMRSRGFTFLKFSTRSYGDCVFLNNESCRFSKIDLLYWKIQGRYLPGLARVISRAMHLKWK